MRERSDDGWHVIGRMHEAIYGYRNRPGLIDEVERNKRRIEHLEQFRRDIEALKEWARWLALGVVSLGGLLMSDGVGRIIGRLAAIWHSSQP